MTNVDITFESISAKQGKFGVITLNKPAQLNALNHLMFQSLYEHLFEWQNNRDIKAIILKAAPGRAFCAGGDLKITHAGIKQSLQAVDFFFKEEYKLNSLIHHYSKPYISFIDGIIMGGGAGISIHGSHRVGTENVLFAMPETGIGFFPDVGGTYFLSHLPHAMGMYLGLTGDRIKLDDCLQLGLITHYIPQAQLENCLQKIIDIDFSKQNPLDTINHILHEFKQNPLQENELLQHHTFIEKTFSLSSLDQIMQELHQSTHPIAQHALTLISKSSPTSLKVTFKALKNGEKLNFDACMQMETILAQHFIREHDFLEGIRAAIIDKDRSPKWNPGKLSEVSDNIIDAYFTPISMPSSVE